MIFLDDVACNGTEDKLTDCSSSELNTHNCDPLREAAGVICGGVCVCVVHGRFDWNLCLTACVCFLFPQSLVSMAAFG